MTTPEATETPAPAPRSAAGTAVSVVIPCLNEEASVAACVEQALEGLAAGGYEGEVLVVDNGSTDRSAEQAAKAGARVLHEGQRGKGHAARTGIREARGEVIVLADADGTYDLRRLKPLIDPLFEGYDMVVGNRLKGEIEENAMPWLHRYVGNPLLGGIIGLAAGRRFGDCLSGLRAFRKEGWSRMSPRSPGFELETEICLRAGRHKLKVYDVPIPYGVRMTPSKLSALRDGWRIVRFILVDSADAIFLPPGLSGLVLAIGLLVAGLLFSSIEFGSARWEVVFAGSVLAPAALAAVILGLATRWLHWRRGVVQDPGGFVRSLSDRRARRMEILFLIGGTAILAGLVLNARLLAGSDFERPSPFAVMAAAQALLVCGVELILGALLFGVLRYLPIQVDVESD